MKKILASLLAAYAVTNGQTPPIPQTSGSGAPPLVTPPHPEAPPPPQAPPIPSVPGIPAAVPPVPPPGAVDPANTAAPVTTTVTVPGSTMAATVNTGPSVANPSSTTTATPRLITIAPSSSPTAPPTGFPTSSPTAPPTNNPVAPLPPPLPLSNPDCPPRSGMGMPTGPTSADQACTLPGQVASDFMGKIRCDAYSCCNCQHITCGYKEYGCEAMQFGDHGAIGVKSIWVDGRFVVPATLECDGLSSCARSHIIANYLWKGRCGADFSCAGAHVEVYNPANGLEFDISGASALQGGAFEVIIGDPSIVCTPGMPAGSIDIQKITISGHMAGQDAVISVKNLGCGAVNIRNLECLDRFACPNTQFIFEGLINIANCNLVGVKVPALLPPGMQSCMAGASNVALTPQAPAPATPPPFVPAPIPVIPTNPAPAPPVINPSTAAPVVPATTVPPVVNPTTTAPPVNPPPPVVTAAPVNPTTTAPPPPPVNPPPPPPPPVVPPPPPPPPPTVPQPPVVTAPQRPPIMPAPPQLLAPGHRAKLTCDGVHSICSNLMFSVDVFDHFQLECNMPGSCAAGDITLNAGMDAHARLPVTEVTVLKFNADAAGAGLTVHLKDTRPPPYPGMTMPKIHVGDLRCEKPASCVGLTIYAGPTFDIAGMNLDCSEPHYCSNCQVIQGNFVRQCAQQMPPQQNYGGGNYWNYGQGHGYYNGQWI